MLSRNNPIHPAFKKEAVELIGTFTYAANPSPDEYLTNAHLAFLKGTSEVWEYYRTSTGAPGKRSVSKRTINYRFHLNALGYCTAVIDLDRSRPDETSYWYALEILYPLGSGWTLQVMTTTRIGDMDVENYIWPEPDPYGNNISFTKVYTQPDSYYRITYDYLIPRGNKNYSFIPSQNLISQEYSLLEVMQWLPLGTHQRKAAGGTFKVDGQWVNQDQVYKNFQFDANGNQTSVTYGDDIVQRTTWHCQE
jgi:hypothetical protein